MRPGWGRGRKARIVMHMEDPPYSVKQTKWRRRITPERWADSSFTFLIAKAQSSFSEDLWMVEALLLVSLKNLYFSLIFERLPSLVVV